MASISLQNVTKVFDRHITAIRDLTLEARDGELMVIVGPSGCGKTTLLRLVAGLESPTSGSIRLAERMINDVPPRQRDVAMVFQDGALYPHMSVYDNLAFALRMRKLPAGQVKGRVDAAAAMLGIADLLDRRPAALSGGQRQRVALGRAIVREPAVFLFDEPLNGLDASLRLAMRAEIKAVHQRLRATMLYVTHDQSEAMALGERLCVLRRGRVQQVGPPGEIYHRPVNRFIAGFFGSPAMNLLAARLGFDRGTCFAQFPTGRIRLPAVFSPCLGEHEGRPVLVGIRPHDLSLEPLSGQSDDVLRGRVSLVEPLGSRTDVHLVLVSGEPCVVSSPTSHRVEVGDEVGMRIDVERVHLFESAEPGRNLLLSATRGD